jgi:hypothetical protein
VIDCTRPSAAVRYYDQQRCGFVERSSPNLGVRPIYNADPILFSMFGARLHCQFR